MRILVTGGAGYIGSHAVRCLVHKGHTVSICDNLSTGHRFLANGQELVVSDIGDLARLLPVLRRVDAVMHFGAHAYVAESVKNPQKYFANNVNSGLRRLSAAVDSGIRRFPEGVCSL